MNPVNEEEPGGPNLTRKWPKASARKRQFAHLAIATGEEFERRVLPFLRALWPDLTPALAARGESLRARQNTSKLADF